MKKKIVFLIGGSGLIGKQIEKKLNKEKYKVFNLDIVKSGKNFVHFDCSLVNKIDYFLNDLFKKYKLPDILINCSYPTSKDWIKNDFQNLSHNTIKKNIDMHLVSYTLSSNFFAKQLVKNKKKGKIILFSSIYGFLAQNSENYAQTQIRENVTYSIIKGGILSLVKQMAAYYGKHNIEINAISPGAVLGHVKGLKNKQDPKFLKSYIKNTPMKRLSNPKEIANLVNFLASEECSYVTGQNLIIDGGYSII